MGVLSYITDSIGFFKDVIVGGVEEGADFAVEQSYNAFNAGNDVTPEEQMFGSVVIALAAIGASPITLGYTLLISLVMMGTFFWGFARWLWGLGQEATG